MPGEIREDYLKSYEGDQFVESMRYVRSYPDELPSLAHRLPEIETPVQIIAGRRDRSFRSSTPSSSMSAYPTAG